MAVDPRLPLSQFWSQNIRLVLSSYDEPRFGVRVPETIATVTASGFELKAPHRAAVYRFVFLSNPAADKKESEELRALADELCQQAYQLRRRGSTFMSTKYLSHMAFCTFSPWRTRYYDSSSLLHDSFLRGFTRKANDRVFLFISNNLLRYPVLLTNVASQLNHSAESKATSKQIVERVQSAAQQVFLELVSLQLPAYYCPTRIESEPARTMDTNRPLPFGMEQAGMPSPVPLIVDMDFVDRDSHSIQRPQLFLSMDPIQLHPNLLELQA